VEAVLVLLFAILGLAIGSFLNVCMDRLPRGESILRPPSCCEHCRHPLRPGDLIPLYSYLRLRGRCRYCGAAISRRSLWVELATGVIFAFLAWRYGLSPELGITAFYACVFIIVFVVDLEHGLILNAVVYPAIVVSLLLALLPPAWFEPWLAFWTVPSIANAAIAGGGAFAFFLLLAVVSRGGMGWGDVKLAGLIGVATGIPLVFVSLVIGALAGGVVAIVLLAARRKKRRETIPFGPFLAAGAMLTMLWGNEILALYIGAG